MLINKTEAAVLFESNQPLRIVDVNLPDNLEPGQVLVELITSGICGAQINEIDAVKGEDNFSQKTDLLKATEKLNKAGNNIEKQRVS